MGDRGISALAVSLTSSDLQNLWVAECKLGEVRRQRECLRIFALQNLDWYPLSQVGLTAIAQLIPFTKKLKQLWIGEVSHTGRAKLQAAKAECNLSRASPRDFQLYIW